VVESFCAHFAVSSVVDDHLQKIHSWIDEESFWSFMPALLPFFTETANE